MKEAEEIVVFLIDWTYGNQEDHLLYEVIKNRINTISFLRPNNRLL